MMKILYVFLGGDMDKIASGVQKKVLAKVDAINELGVSCQGLSLSQNIDKEQNIDNRFLIIPFKHTTKKYFNTYGTEKSQFEALMTWFSFNIHKYDVVFFRYPLASFSLLKLVKKYPGKFIFEHNTKEIEELQITLKRRRDRIPNIIRPWYFIYRFEVGYLPLFMEKILAPKIFKYARSGIAVTQEIANYEQARCNRYEVKVISNSISVHKCKLRTFMDYDKKELKLFMLLGNAFKWHGCDRLINSLANYQGKVKITIDIFGALLSEDIELINNSVCKGNINLIPSVPFNELDSYLNNYHLGIGTLAIHRTALAEASPLKTREYFARGYACLIGYEDTDIILHSEFAPYCFSAPNDESLIDFVQVVSFAEKLYEDKSHHLKIRNLAERFLDTKVKMNAMLNHIKEELNKTNHV